MDLHSTAIQHQRREDGGGHRKGRDGRHHPLRWEEVGAEFECSTARVITSQSLFLFFEGRVITEPGRTYPDHTHDAGRRGIRG